MQRLKNQNKKTKKTKKRKKKKKRKIQIEERTGEQRFVFRNGKKMSIISRDTKTDLFQQIRKLVKWLK